MKRRGFLKHAATGMVAGAVASPAIAQTLPTLRWRLQTSWPKSLDTIYGSADALCQRVGELTEGKFTIRCFAGGEIVPALQVMDAVQAGTVECGHTLTLVLHRQESRLQLRCGHRLRPQHAPAERLDVLRRRQGADPGAVQEGQHHAARVRQCRRPDGWLVPQGDQYGRGPQRPQVPHRRARRA